MTKAVSFRDVIHVLKELQNKEFSEIELVQPANDALVKPILFEMGIDVRFPLDVIVHNHRDLNNNTGIGFLYEGRMRRDRTWLTSPWCSMPERIGAAVYEDISLAHDLCAMMGGSIDWVEGAHYVSPELPKSQIEPEYEYNDVLIKNMQYFADVVRGKETNGTN
jgi:hypothetical protein